KDGTVAGDECVGVQFAEVVEGLNPFGGVAVVCERDGSADEIANDGNFFFEEINHGVTSCVSASEEFYFDLAATEVDGKIVFERNRGALISESLDLVEIRLTVVQNFFDVLRVFC